jgi:uncharacterized FlgJ-related protein
MNYYRIVDPIGLVDRTYEVELKINQWRAKFYLLAFSFIAMVFVFAFQLKRINDDLISANKINAQSDSTISMLNNSKELAYNLHNVNKFVDNMPFKNKELVKRQMRLESGNTLSKVARNNNNLFGMKSAGKRPQLGSKSKFNDYRHYSHWTQSVMDRYLYELHCGTSLKGYAEDAMYSTKLTR